MDLNSSDLGCAHGVSQWSGMRFNNLNIPPGSYITSAHIQFETDENRNDDPVTSTIYSGLPTMPPLLAMPTSTSAAAPGRTGSINWYRLSGCLSAMPVRLRKRRTWRRSFRNHQPKRLYLRQLHCPHRRGSVSRVAESFEWHRKEYQLCVGSISIRRRLTTARPVDTWL